MFAVLVQDDGGHYVLVVLTHKFERANSVGKRYRLEGHQVVVRTAGTGHVAAFAARKATRENAKLEAFADKFIAGFYGENQAA